MSYHRISVILSNCKCHLAMGKSRALSAKVRHYHVLIDELPSSRRVRFLKFWTIELIFIVFACKNQYFVVDWSRWIFTGEKVNWPAAYSWITLDSRYMAKISAAAYLRLRLISEYIRYLIPSYEVPQRQNENSRICSKAFTTRDRFRVKYAFSILQLQVETCNCNLKLQLQVETCKL